MTEAKNYEFQAETKKLLDIVINSLYTERDVFVRELISNSADALEKMRHEALTCQEVLDEDLPLEITIDLDEEAHTLTISDSGIGMTEQELVNNLGVIAHSGSGSFYAELAEAVKKDVNLIGQFGVGFYAAFMAGNKVRVQTRSWDGSQGHEWLSEGAGSFTITPLDGLARGTRIVVELKDDAHEYAQDWKIKNVIEQYSSFVSFPIKLKGEVVNTVQALWSRSKSEISDEEYNEFYKFIGNATEDPSYRLHFSADAPLSIKSLLFVPKENFEVMGFGRVEPGVNLYCQRILIDQHSENILPGWLRFLKGVVDSEDLPLNISRQSLQDNALVSKIRRVVTKRFLKYLAEEATRDESQYLQFWSTFGIYLKEGVTTDYEYQKELGKLLRFETSKSELGVPVSLADYLLRMNPDQEKIYYINGASRAAIEAGPYVEMFKKKDIEIVYTLDPIDDFVLSHLQEFEGKKLVSADGADISLDKEEAEDALVDESGVDKAELAELLTWMKEELKDEVGDVLSSHRLVDAPAMIVNADGFMSASMERVLAASRKEQGIAGVDGSKKHLEINGKNPLIKQLAELRKADAGFAGEVAHQILDNAMIQAGLVVDPLKMVARNYKILDRAVSRA
ncbi:molecular chaperone HtpG [Desulfotalea psychrophila]|uniref:Chaperone protein HtpG n=1 Tax=Desulfotalea psychrophila (strain LSv54 / DSM 12343) TaxID=177439 RepID=HTPG_DESPS|nr:molecular chaperone HtpG [Desulfotalea psychrophila]Q6ARM0.1 RecName: Full=Chaperone protein HtpG; AltName: Full=Heat shock protein HtpG; AltName: Full=High temperature protein G [Desulfotalea psychrophila LSv54]CAG35005.1 related to heat shock protein Hsp90 [Desulfotalea psychrophila LSv54]